METIEAGRLLATLEDIGTDHAQMVTHARLSDYA